VEAMMLGLPFGPRCNSTDCCMTAWSEGLGWHTIKPCI